MTAFKVGDRVRIVDLLGDDGYQFADDINAGLIVDGLGTVTELNERTGDVCVKTDAPDSTDGANPGWYFTPSQLEHLNPQ